MMMTSWIPTAGLFSSTGRDWCSLRMNKQETLVKKAVRLSNPGTSTQQNATIPTIFPLSFSQHCLDVRVTHQHRDEWKRDQRLAGQPLDAQPSLNLRQTHTPNKHFQEC